MVKESLNYGVDLIRLGSSQPQNQEQRIEQRKIYSKLMNQSNDRKAKKKSLSYVLLCKT